MENFWNTRYAEDEFAYGTAPNRFLEEQLEVLTPGKIILPCEGEGRNAVYAAMKGWEVEAFDMSEEGFNKSMKLAQQNNVRINYHIADAGSIDYPAEIFDVAALIYTHLPPSVRSAFHHKVISWLRPGGVMILEAFNSLQARNASGGPKDPSMLYTQEILEEDFKQLKVKLLTNTKITLDEGKYHQGPADVIRFVGIKQK